MKFNIVYRKQSHQTTLKSFLGVSVRVQFKRINGSNGRSKVRSLFASLVFGIAIKFDQPDFLQSMEQHP